MIKIWNAGFAMKDSVGLAVRGGGLDVPSEPTPEPGCAGELALERGGSDTLVG